MSTKAKRERVKLILELVRDNRITETEAIILSGKGKPKPPPDPPG